jgi:predicted CXXCH cytochrome family protein
MVAAGAAFALAPVRPVDPPPAVRATPDVEYVTSAACKGCHPSEYASFARTYHRTMTQAATASNVAAPFAQVPDGVTRALGPGVYALDRRGAEAWAIAPDAPPARVVLTTGSHHYQAYWTLGAAGEPSLFPFVYLLGDAPGWIARRDAFVQPPGQDLPVRWGSTCLPCHTTGGSPGVDPQAVHEGPEVAELGVACEACHGPGAAHVAAHASPFERMAASATDRADPDLVNPSRLSAERASMICGACHAYAYPRDEADYWAHGYARSFRPGEDLGTARILLTRALLGQPGAPVIDADPASLFYDDGTVRIGGREYTGLVESACYLRGEGDRKLSCLSCHWMHDSPPEGQLAKGRDGDGACAGCHEPARYAASAHTHHAAGSPGSACVACHMPRTSYALLHSIRSHRIDSPSAVALEADRPGACNLCHLDRTLGWTRRRLAAWYGQPAPPGGAGDEDAGPPAGAAWLLAGDPGQRAIAADAMGLETARAAMRDRASRAPLLRAALVDPYAAVRFIAARSLRAVPDEGAAATVTAETIAALVAARSPRALTLSE